jgi:hypothetical protein
MYGASPGYFRTLGARLVAGREFEDRDVPGSPRVAIVNQAFVKKLIRDGNAIGKRFRFSENSRWLEIVGVAEDGKYRSLSEGPTPVIFRPILQTENLNTHGGGALVLARYADSGCASAHGAGDGPVDRDF